MCEISQEQDRYVATDDISYVHNLNMVEFLDFHIKEYSSGSFLH